MSHESHVFITRHLEAILQAKPLEGQVDKKVNRACGTMATNSLSPLPIVLNNKKKGSAEKEIG